MVKAVQGLGHVDLGLVVHRCQGQGNHRIHDVHGNHGIVDRRRETNVSPEAQSTPNIAPMWPAGMLLHVLHFRRVHADQAAHLDLSAVPGIDQGVALFHGSLVDADVSQLAVLAVFQLEGQCHGGFVKVAGQDDGLFVVVQVNGFVFNVGGGGQVFDHSVQQGLNSGVLVSGAHEDRGHVPGDGTGPYRLDDQLLCDLFFFQNGVGKFFGIHGGCIDHLFAFFQGLVHEICRNILGDDLFSILSFKIVGLHGDEVHHPFKLVFQTDGDLHQHRIVSQFCPAAAR